MKFIEEVVVEEFLPTFRSLLAEELHDRGLTQNEVAELLGLSQSAVSKYVHGDVERNERVIDDERVREHVRRLAEGLATGSMTPVQALAETEVFLRRLERGDLLARLHEEAVPALADYGDDRFAVHDPDSTLRQSERVLSSLRRGLRTLETTPGFSSHVPAVGSNLVECLPEAATIEDVAAVPGRILDLKGRVTVPDDPAFGASEHVATVLLTARDHGSDARAALNLRYDPETIDRLAELGYVAVEFDAEADLTAAIGEALETFERAASDPDRSRSGSHGDRGANGDSRDRPDTVVEGPDVLYQTGGFGIEPIVYVLGPDAPTVAGVVREL